MNDPGGVRCGHSVRDLNGAVQKFSHRAAGCETVARNKLHHEIVRPNVIELADIGMAESRHGSGLTFEPCADVFRRDLNGYGTAESRIARTVYGAHSAGADQRHNLVWPHTGPCGEPHSADDYIVGAVQSE